MADEAKLIVELQDRSGQGSSSASGPAGQGNFAEIPGSSVAKDFFQKVGDKGAQASAIEAIRAIYQADPNVTSQELQRSLGFSASEANRLLEQVRGTPTAPPAAQPSAVPQTPPSNIPVTAPTTPTTSQSVPPPVPSGPLDIDEIAPGTNIFGDPRDRFDFADASEKAFGQAAKIMDTLEPMKPPETPKAPVPIVPPPKDSNMDEAGQIGAAVMGKVLSQFGQPGAALGGAITTAAAQFPGTVGALFANLAPAAPYIATGAAALAVPAALGYSVLNEAERARGIVGNLSPEAAVAQAQANADRIMANIRTAERLGDEVGEYIESRSRLTLAAQGIRDVAAEPVLQSLNEVLGTLGKTLELINGNAQQNGSITQAILQGTTKAWSDIVMMTPLFAKLNAWLEENGSHRTPFDWFKMQEHLYPAPPSIFAGVSSSEIDIDKVGGDFTAVPGLEL